MGCLLLIPNHIYFENKVTDLLLDLMPKFPRMFSLISTIMNDPFHTQMSK